MSQQTNKLAPAFAGGGDEWAVGMPAYWLKQVAEPSSAAEAEVLTRYYHVKPHASTALYDQRLIVRVGGTEKALLAVVGFVLRYALSMGHRITAVSIKTVQERFVRAWELAGRPGRYDTGPTNTASAPSGGAALRAQRGRARGARATR